jgi:phosphoribosylformylglycinamidine synthase
MSAISGKGLDIDVTLLDPKDIFSESLSRAIVEVEPQNCDAFESMAHSQGVIAINAGVVGGDELSINNAIHMEVSTLQDIYLNTFKKIIEQDL